MERFIDMYLEYYGLDPCHLFRSPRLNLDAMLKMPGIEKLISDISMYLFVEKRMRASISFIPKRYSNANNKYMKSYDDSKPIKCIIHINANNLYGWATSRYLPYSKFKLLT